MTSRVTFADFDADANADAPCGLPVELWWRILSHLAEAHLLRRIAPVCRIFRSIVHDMIRFKLHREDYGLDSGSLAFSKKLSKVVGVPKAVTIRFEDFDNQKAANNIKLVLLEWKDKIDSLTIHDRYSMVREFTGVLSSLSSLKGLHIVCKSIDASKNCLASTLGHELEAVVLANAKTLKSLTVDLQSIHGINLLFSHQMTTDARVASG